MSRDLRFLCPRRCLRLSALVSWVAPAEGGIRVAGAARGPVVSRTRVSWKVTRISALACPGAVKPPSAIAERTADQREPCLLCVQSEPQNLSRRRTLSGQPLPVCQNRHVACKLPAICPRIWATKSLVTSTWQSNDVSGLLTASTRPSPYGLVQAAEMGSFHFTYGQ